MERDRLFVQTIDWLAEVGYRHPPDEHELLLASGRLRLLLLDAGRLVDQVNRTRRFDLRYRILRHGDGPPLQHLLKLWAVPDGLAPELMGFNHNIPIESVKLEALLHERVMIYEGEDVTVRDLIDHVANVVGGVHAGKALESKDQKLNELAEEVVIQGMDVAVRCLRSIVVVVVEALRPLRDAIAGEPR
jgi:hypothetical protein